MRLTSPLRACTSPGTLRLRYAVWYACARLRARLCRLPLRAPAPPLQSAPPEHAPLSPRRAQVEWDSLATDALPEVPVAGDSIADLIEDPSLRPIETIKVQPVQFHFHGVSEHLIEGNYVRPRSPRAPPLREP